MPRFTTHINSYRIEVLDGQPPITSSTLIFKIIDEIVEYCKKDTDWREGDLMNFIVENE